MWKVLEDIEGLLYLDLHYRYAAFFLLDLRLLEKLYSLLTALFWSKLLASWRTAMSMFALIFSLLVFVLICRLVAFWPTSHPVVRRKKRDINRRGNPH